MSLPGVRAIFFDLDDTLCGYWDACKIGLRQTFMELAPVPYEEMMAAWAAAFREFGGALKGSPWYPIYLQQGGVTRSEQMRLALERLGVADPALAHRMGDRYGELRDQNLKLFEESLEVLAALEQRFPLGLITNGPADIQRQEIATLGLVDRFEPVLIEGELGFGKPDPRVYAIARERMESRSGDLEPHEILMVGNSYGHDIKGALMAGWQTVWIRRPSDVSPSSEKPEERPPTDPEPHLEINDLRELL